MPAFLSPLVDPAAWSYSIASLSIPSALRYGGYTLRAVRATLAGGGNVQLPASGVLRKASATGLSVVELQVLPAPTRHVLAALAGGIPTFYLAFADDTGLTFDEGDGAAGGEVLRAASEVQIACAFQDRIVRDPALWAQQLHEAMTATAGDVSAWQPFLAALDAALNAGPAAPVMALSHEGTPMTAGALDAVFGAAGAEATHRITLDPADGGDVQRAVARLNAGGVLPIANLWSAGPSFRLRPAGAAGADFQLATLENAASAEREIVVTPTTRHVCLTNVADWYAPQGAIPDGMAVPALTRYTRGNRVTPLVNGPEFFDDLFVQLRDAAAPGGGLHLTGWSMFPQTKFVRRRIGDAADVRLTLARAEELIGADGVPLTLEQAATRIANAGGATRFLPAQHIQIRPNTVVDDAVVLSALLFISGLLVLHAKGVNFARMDATGAVLLMGAWMGGSIVLGTVVGDNGELLQPTREAVDVLAAVAGAQSRYSPYPATILDNPLAPAPNDLPFNAIFDLIRHFGVYHQKFAIVRTAATHIGYCGGIDLNPDRLDDVHHLHKSPYHDVHARVDGPAVSDLARSFEERWQRDGGGTTLAFATPAPGTLGAPGSDVVQVARTYFRPADAARRLEFAPNGDSTLEDTMLRAIAQAREYIYIEEQYLTPPGRYTDALLARLSSGSLRKLIVMVPGYTTQPFGEVARGEFIDTLRAADPGGVVHIGFPRRRPMVPDNELRASSGRLRLQADLQASGGIETPILLGPKARVPSPPFWLAIDGELMWVHRVSTLPNPDPSRIVIMLADRGADTRLVSAAPDVGPSVRAHKALAAATVVTLDHIYVHSKMIIVDDVFLGVGSANLNRRGFCHDGEINIYCLRQLLKAHPDNPIAHLRRRLWAEALDLPLSLAEPLLADPLAAAALFSRSPFLGNRFAGIDAQQKHVMFGKESVGSVFQLALQGLVASLTAAVEDTAYDTLSDPSSSMCPE